MLSVILDTGRRCDGNDYALKSIECNSVREAAQVALELLEDDGAVFPIRIRHGEAVFFDVNNLNPPWADAETMLGDIVEGVTT